MTGETLDIFRRSFSRLPLIWICVAVIATGTNLIDLVYGVGAGRAFSMLQVASIILRFFGVFWLGAVVLRAFAGSPPEPLRLDRGIGFFLGWQIVLLLAQALVNFALWPVETKIEPWLAAIAEPQLVVLVCIGLATPVVDLISLRIIPWVVDRTTLAPAATLGAAWRGMRGHWRGAAKAYVALVFPLFVVHYGLTAWLSHAAISWSLRLGATIFDGIESVFLLMMLLSLYLACTTRAKSAA